MVGLISARALSNLGALLNYCPVSARRPANPAEYAAAFHAAVGDDPPPYDRWEGTTYSPVVEVDARNALYVGMTVWQLGRFMRVADVQPYVHDCGSLCMAQVPYGREITFIGADGSTSCRLVGGYDPVPAYCWLR